MTDTNREHDKPGASSSSLKSPESSPVIAKVVTIAGLDPTPNSWATDLWKSAEHRVRSTKDKVSTGASGAMAAIQYGAQVAADAVTAGAHVAGDIATNSAQVIGETAKTIATTLADQNGDGKVDQTDVALLTREASAAVKAVGSQLGDAFVAAVTSDLAKQSAAAAAVGAAIAVPVPGIGPPIGAAIGGAFGAYAYFVRNGKK